MEGYGDTIYEGISISKRKKVIPFKKFSKSSDLIFVLNLIEPPCNLKN